MTLAHRPSDHGMQGTSGSIKINPFHSEMGDSPKMGTDVPKITPCGCGGAGTRTQTLEVKAELTFLAATMCDFL